MKLDTKERFLRFLASGSVTIFMLLIIFFTIPTLTKSLHHLLWGVPVIAVSTLDIYFLTRSLLQQPKKIDTRISSLFIGLGTTFGLSVAAMLTTAPRTDWAFAAQLRQVGVAMSLLPYPLVIWALLCLKDCLTVVPEAHAVVAHGPYKYSRHPLYACYMVWAFANVLLFPTWYMLAASAAQVIFLTVRFRREEQLLLSTFPEYESYYRRTGLFWPRNP